MSPALLLTVGLVADTHIPDRTPSLNPGLLQGLSAAGVGQILHAGDVCVQRVLDELGEIAPVLAARGNRDIFFSPALPMTVNVTLAGVAVSLQHGHGGTRTYWLDKFAFVYEGYQKKRYARRLRAAAPGARVYVFGHTHHAENFEEDGRLFVNPGSMVGLSVGGRYFPPSYGLLRIYEGGRVQAELLRLE